VLGLERRDLYLLHCSGVLNSMPWFLGVACLFEGGPILLEAMFAFTLFDLVGVVVKVLGGRGWFRYGK